MQKISSCLWFNDQAEEAANYYVSVFQNSSASARGKSEIGKIARYGEAAAEVSGKPKGSVMTVSFRLDGQEFIALNGGPEFKFSEALSLVINCESQEEVDYFWNKLSEGGDPKAQICGWLKDKYGLSWQVTPTLLEELLDDPDPVKAERVMKAMLGMKKIYIQELKDAYAQN